MIKLHWKRLNWRRVQRVARRAAPLAACGLVAAVLPASSVRAQAPLPTDHVITPLGTQENIGSLPDSIILTPDGKFAIVSDCGFRELLSVLSATGANAGRLANQPDSSPIIQGTPGTATFNGALIPNGGLNNTFPSPFPSSLPNNYDTYPTSTSQLRFGDAYVYNAGLYYGTAVKSNGDGTYTLYASRGSDSKIFTAKPASPTTTWVRPAATSRSPPIRPAASTTIR